MDKKTYDIISEFSTLANNLYFELEKKLGIEEADKLVSGFDEVYSRELKIGKYLDEELVLNKEGYLSEKYKEFPSYLKVNVIYEYENGYSLCETTSGIIALMPTDLIKTEV